MSLIPYKVNVHGAAIVEKAGAPCLVQEGLMKSSRSN